MAELPRDGYPERRSDAHLRRVRLKRAALRGRLLRLTVVALAISGALTLVDSPAGMWQLKAAWGLLGVSLALGLVSLGASWIHEYRAELRQLLVDEVEKQGSHDGGVADETELAAPRRGCEEMRAEGEHHGRMAGRAEAFASALVLGMSPPLAGGVVMIIFFAATNLG